MRKIAKIAAVLTWFNLVVWGLLLTFGILFALALHSFPVLVLLFLLSSILLHNYAALQLQRSLKNPDRPLGNQTPSGIRFVGFVALFFGVSFVANGLGTLLNAGDILLQVKEAMTGMQKQLPAGTKGFTINYTINYIYAMGSWVILLGLAIALNVFFNFRLLRWYFLARGNGIQ
ncbi:hypothetical protein ACX0G9_11790 [Flavitalea flava]